MLTTELWEPEADRSRSVGVDSGGVLTIFENRSETGVDFFKEEPELEWSRSQFFNRLGGYFVYF